MGVAVNGNGRYCPVVIFTFGVYKVQRAIPKICLFHLSFDIVGRDSPARVLLYHFKIQYVDVQTAAPIALVNRVRINDQFNGFALNPFGLSGLYG